MYTVVYIYYTMHQYDTNIVQISFYCITQQKLVGHINLMWVTSVTHTTCSEAVLIQLKLHILPYT